MKHAHTNILATSGLLALMALHASASHAQVQFSAEMAFRRLYGNYDPQSKTAIWKDFSFPKTGEEEERNRFICETDEEPLTVRVLLDKEVKESEVAKHYFVTWASPTSWGEGSGRQCNIVVGATVFAKRGGKWDVESSNRYLASAGTYGGPPERVEFVRIGPQKHGVILETSDLNQGYSGTSAKLIMPLGMDFREVWGENISRDNAGACSDDEQERNERGISERCYQSYATYQFVHGSNAEYFDILVVSQGTSADSERKIVSANWKKLYRFIDGEYKLSNTVPTSPANNQTSSKAKRSALPRFADFTDYKVAEEWAAAPAKLRLENRSDRMFRSQFLWALRRRPNFAGHYRVATWGCGTQCMAGGIVDLATGQLHPLPGSLGTTGWEKWMFCVSLFGDSAIAKAVKTRVDSRLLIIRCADATGRDDGSYEHTSYFAFEDNTFRKVAESTGIRVF